MRDKTAQLMAFVMDLAEETAVKACEILGHPCRIRRREGQVVTRANSREQNDDTRLNLTIKNGVVRSVRRG